MASFGGPASTPQDDADGIATFPLAPPRSSSVLVAEEPGMLTIEVEKESDGRWIGEVTALPGAMAYGTTEAEARQKAAAFALRVIADRIEHGEPVPEEARSLFALA
jgi:predicted RNase H-like HicB family nuclease